MIRRSLALAAVLLGATPAAALGHAVLERTEPERGAHLDSAPAAVDLRFNEPVEASFGAVRVYDRDGERVDTGELVRPGGSSDAVGVDLGPDLPDGIYTATYRVISADSHPVAGGLTFTVGDHAGGAGLDVDELLADAGSGPVTDAGLGAARVATYVATAIAIGGILFLVVVWGPALRAAAGPAERWHRAAEAFGAALRRLLVAAIAVGAAATALGIALQGAVALGESLWQALKPGVLEEVLGTRFGVVWAIRLADWGLVATLVLVPVLGVRFVTLAPARLGAAGSVPVDPLPAYRLGLGALVIALGFLALAPGLAGHAGVTDPVWALLPLNAVHVLAFAAWAGGLCTLLLAVPRATRLLEPEERTAILAAAVSRFSALALAAVAALLATGVVQSLLLLESWQGLSLLEAIDALATDLVGTGYGRAILAKAALLAALVGVGAYNRQRLRPRLDELALGGEAPGAPGRLLRRTVRAEIGLIVGVLVATAFLAALAPSGASPQGPYSTSTEIGEARLELTVDPAAVGTNEIHLYLFDRADGSQLDDAREAGVEARLPAEEIGPLEQDVHRAGPGHYVVHDAQLGVAGEWELDVTARVSAFEEHRAVIEVPIE